MMGGDFVRGVSGGERKCVCIGNEILLNPSLLFLDEPTTGLDSTTALGIIQTLHNLAQVLFRHFTLITDYSRRVDFTMSPTTGYFTSSSRLSN